VSDQVSYSYARQNFAKLLRDAEDSREAVIIRRRGHEDMALLPADELRGLQEAAHLLRSPRNAQRLLQALQRALAGEGREATPSGLRAELGLE